jgi:hypothetical protein
MTATQTTGQQLTATLRKSFQVGPRTRDYRDGLSLKDRMLESIENAITYPGYYGPERTALSQAASGALRSYQKHVDGYRIDGDAPLPDHQHEPLEVRRLHRRHGRRRDHQRRRG